MNVMNNTFEIEKLYSEPGIYIIYNKIKRTAYIGQTKDLKERMRQHLDALYSNKTKMDNKNLLSEFNKGNNFYLYRVLDKVDKSSLHNMESLYFQAAEMYFKKERVHNEVDLKSKYKPSEDELNRAKEKIESTITKEMNTPIIWIDDKTKRRINQDIVGKYKKDIISGAYKKTKKNSGKQIEFEQVSVKDLYENGKLDHIIIGKMGDYIGKDKSQSLTDIIEEKLACISDNKKCLWATNSSGVDEINNFIHKYGFGEEKRVYAIFGLTSTQYKSKYKLQKYIHKETGLFDTAPENKGVKALIIDKIMSVKEDFDFRKFIQNYYYHSVVRDGISKKSLVNEEIASCSQLPAKIVSRKSAILSNDELRKELAINEFDKMEMDKFKASIPNEKINFNDAHGASYFILAEVTKAVWIYPVES